MIRLPAIVALSAAILLCSPEPAWAQAQRARPAPPALTVPTSADQAIMDLQAAFRRGDKARFAQLLPLAASHPLEPWAMYWDLKQRLETATPQEVQDFYARYPGTYVEDRLRNDWLLLLGQRRDFAAFMASHPQYRMGDDKEVRCYALSQEAPSAESAAQVKVLWHALRDTDDGCTFAAGKLLSARRLAEAEVWRKARLAIEANRPRAAIRAAELVEPDAGPAIAELHEASAKYLNKRMAAPGRAAKELVVLALVRMATQDPNTAAATLENHWSVHLNPEQKSWAWGVIGKTSASRLSNEALGYFSNARDKDLPDEHLAWKVRAALRKAQWHEVLAATQAMSPESATDPTWVYWRARALQKLARTPEQQAEATLQLQSIAGVKGFYEQLAAEELGQMITAPERPPAPTPEEFQAAQSSPALQRALHAIRIGLRAEGVREWNYATNLHVKGGMTDRELLAAADLACSRQVWDRCINTSERTKGVLDMAQRFPMPFRDQVVARAQAIELDPAYVYGLIRQESRFIMDARSHVGASGLMQVMPATARWTAKHIGLKDFKPGDITDRDTNIAIGTGYLKLVLDDFMGSMPLAAAAYNAGPGRPRAWRGPAGSPTVEAAIWAENVPFAETRDYVKKVLSNTTMYAALITGRAQSLKARLGMVGPREGGSPAPNTALP